jgi:hypothetical protein
VTPIVERLERLRRAPMARTTSLLPSAYYEERGLDTDLKHPVADFGG